jgi:hypothetical protein
MGTTIDDVHYEEYLERMAEEHRKVVWGALKKIADSKTVNELQSSLESLKEVYIDSDFYDHLKIDEDKIDRLINELDLSMPALRDEIKREITNSTRSSAIFGWAGIIVGLVGIGVSIFSIL